MINMQQYITFQASQLMLYINLNMLSHYSVNYFYNEELIFCHWVHSKGK